MNDKLLRTHIENAIRSEEAHADWPEVLKDFPAKLRGVRPAGSPHSPWELLEHARIAQWDILEFSRSQKHVSPDFPSGYWPKNAAPPSDAAWGKNVRAFLRDREAMRKLVASPKTDLFARITHGSGQTILREALLLADHNAYHLGQFLLLRRLLGAWPR
jgi:DinB superfamily